MQNTYKGEITLIKIKDGASIKSVTDYYALGTNPQEPPDAPYVEEDLSLSPIWKTTIPEGFGADYPVIWNFKRTEYGDGKIEHSGVVIASFWATAPEVQAKYHTTQAPAPTPENDNGWEDNFDEFKHNYIIFSYDGGQTWSPNGGIRIKGKINVDEAAIVYDITTSQNEILRYIDQNSNVPYFSPGSLNFSISKEYLGLSEIVELVSDINEAKEGKFKPTLQCTLTSYADLNNPIKLHEISDFYSFLKYEYALNTVVFDFESLYKKFEADRQANIGDVNSQEDYIKVLSILDSVESYLTVTLILNYLVKNPDTEEWVQEEPKIISKNITIRYATNYDLAKLSIYAGGIVQSIQNTKLVFDVEGLSVYNGGLKVFSDKYILTVPDPTTFNQYEYYIKTESGFSKYEGEYVEGLEYYEKTNEKTFGVDDFGNLYVKGTGEFSGKIYASEGEFKGTVKAKGGYLEDLTINGTLTVNGQDGNEIIIEGLYSSINREDISSTIENLEENQLQDFKERIFYRDPVSGNIIKYEGSLLELPDFEFYLQSKQPGIRTNNFVEGTGQGFYLDPGTGSIYANNIILGEGTTIYDKIEFPFEGGIASIQNPEENNGTFIDISKDGNSTLRITTEGIIKAGNIEEDSDYVIINGPQGAIQSGNYIPGGLGWKIDSNIAEFNDIIARGTLRAVTFEKNEVSTVGGMILVRPSAIIKKAVLIEDGAAIELTLETKDITFETQDNPITPYYFRIGADSTAYSMDWESEEGEEEKRIVIRANPNNYGDIQRFVGKLLIGYGHEGDIGVGINSSSQGVAMPPQAISVFETVVEEISGENGDKILKANPRIILGAIFDKENYGLEGYGLYADQVNIKGELTSRSDDYYSGINSKSEIINENNANIILWAGAQHKLFNSDEDAIKNAPFRVDDQGNIYASKGYFSGEIHSSFIDTSILRTAIIEGIGPYGDQGDEYYSTAALQIRNTSKAVEFEDYFVLTNKQILSSVPFIMSNGKTTISQNDIITNTLSLSELLINDSNINIISNEGNLVFKDEEVISVYSPEGFSVKKNSYFDKNIYFGEEHMEYRQITQEYQGVEKIVGYDLYIKS